MFRVPRFARAFIKGAATEGYRGIMAKAQQEREDDVSQEERDFEERLQNDKINATKLMHIDINAAELIEKSKIKAKEDEDIASATFTSALAEIKNLTFVNELKKRGKLTTPQMYEEWKSPWINGTKLGPALFQNKEWQKDWLTYGGTINIDKETDAIKNLSSTDGANVGSSIAQSMIKTKEIPAGVSQTKVQPDSTESTEDGTHWTSKWMKKSKTTAPTSQFLFDKKLNKERWVTNDDKILDPLNYIPIADPEKVTTDLTPFGESTTFAGIYTSTDKPGLYFTNMQLDITNEPAVTKFLNENKNYTIDNQGYVLDVNGKNVPRNIPISQIKDLEAIESMDSYQQFDPSIPAQYDILKANGISENTLNSYKASNKIIQYELQSINGQNVISGEPKVIDIAVANQKFDTSRQVIEVGITNEMVKYFPKESIIFDKDKTVMGFKFEKGTIFAGRNDFFNKKTEQLLNIAIDNRIAPSAKTIVAKTNQLADNYNMLIGVTPFSTDSSEDAVLFHKLAQNSMMGMELIQSYLAHYGQSSVLAKQRDYWLDKADLRNNSDLASHITKVSVKLYQMIQEEKLEKYKLIITK